MKKWLLYFLIFPYLCIGQNLVPNPSFEINTNCPTDINQISYCNNWYSVWGSIDYFNRCCVNSNAGIPNNLAGYQEAKKGNGMIGIGTFSNEINNAREYVGIKLTNSLVKNNVYRVGAYFNLANLSSAAIANIAIYLSVDSLWVSYSASNFNIPCPRIPGQGLVLDCIEPQIKNTSTVINDTLNWVEVNGYFKSMGGERYLTIGNFTHDTSTINQTFQNNGKYDEAYYYIDDVYIVKVPSKDATIKDIKKLDSCFATNDTLWVELQNRGVDSLDFAQEPLPYSVEVRKNGNVVQSFIDSIQSNQYNPVGLPLPLDSSIWFPVVPLNLADFDESYEISIEIIWDLDEDSTNNQIDTTINTNLSFGLADLSEDTICFGDEVQLTTANYKGAIQWQSSLDQTQWQNLMSGDSLKESPTQKTYYRLAVCDTLYSDTFEVEVIQPKIAVQDEQQFCSEEQTISIKKENTYSTLYWYEKKSSSQYFYEGISIDTALKETKTFYLAAVLNGCESEERIPLKINISCEIKIPNVFTPNGDGINDLFVYRNVDESKKLQTKVFNRWGEKVAEWNGNKGWSGDGQAEGVYFYEIHYGEEKITGVVSLIRG